MREYIILILLGLHFVLSCLGTEKLVSRKTLTKQQRIVNIFLLWMIPFLWFIIIQGLDKRTPGSHEVKKKDDVSNNPFHESGKGIWGG